MSAVRRDTCLGFTPERYPQGTHICYLYNDDAEQLGFLRAFISSGIAEGESVDYLADVSTPKELEQVVDDFGVKNLVRAYGDQFAVAMAEATYCPMGLFVPEAMLDRLRYAYTRGQDFGCAGSRISGEMSWALHGIPGSEQLVEYEARINNVVKDIPITVLCQYDTRKFDGATIFEILNVHPIMIVRGQIMRNPFYVRPDQFLAERSAASRH